MSNALRVVAAADAPPAPYPPDTRAKGWTFELDYERIEQSDTWALATPDMRPWLLMVWLTAWRQAPTGSLPNDDELLAARIGMPVRQLQANRDILLRGWRLHDDGRLYHPVLTEQVLNMLDKRTAEAKRKQAWREKNQQLAGNVPRDIHGTPPSATTPPPPPPPPPVEEQTPSLRSGEPAAAPPAPARKPRAKAAEVGQPDDVDPQVWADWLQLRRKKSATVTPGVIATAREEAHKAGMTFEAFLRVWVFRGSQGLFADWIKPHERQAFGRRGQTEDQLRAQQRAANEEAKRILFGNRNQGVIDA